MAILAGIDEAGFGPLLGPLVVSSSVFRVRPELAQEDLWRLLKRSVGKTRKRLLGRLLVADSKKAYKRAEGLGHLERTALAALASLEKEPSTLSELLSMLCPDCLRRLLEYPWYQAAASEPLPIDVADTRIASKVFAADMVEAGASLVGLQSDCLDVAYYNRMIDNVKNKAQVLFVSTTRLIQNILEAYSDDEIRLMVDRQGGRVHYREHLLRSFPEMELKIVQETPDCSIYELLRGARRVRLSFEVGADDRHLPVSLASMVSKYVRERLMDNVNRYFASMSPELKPTAGYWKDGLRFLEDLRVKLPDLQIDRHRLVRCR